MTKVELLRASYSMLTELEEIQKERPEPKWHYEPDPENWKGIEVPWSSLEKWKETLEALIENACGSMI